MMVKHNLTNRDLFVAGFSQGSILAAIVGTHRNARGTVVCGGMPFCGFFQIEKLLRAGSSTSVCMINGTRDDVIEKIALRKTMRQYKTEWHWSKGLGHDFPDEWFAT